MSNPTLPTDSTHALPEGWQKLAYGGEIPSNLRVSWIARLQILPFLVSFWWAAVTACRRCDIIHCHWTISGLVAYLATRQAPRPIVVSARGSDVHLMQGRLVGWLNRRVFRWVDTVIAVSDDIADKIEAAGVDRRKIRVVYNGVGPEFRPRDRQAMRRELDLPESKFIVLFVGLLVPIKGVDVLLQAMSEMADDRFLCVVVGDGPSRAQLERQAEELNIAERCRFAGQRPAFEIPRWLCAADVLVLPSRSEGRPNVILEAHACGLPVVATRVGGTPELIRQDETGILVDPGSSAALVAGLIRISDDRFRAALGKAAREAVEQGDSSWQASAERVMGIYGDLLGREVGTCAA